MDRIHGFSRTRIEYESKEDIEASEILKCDKNLKLSIKMTMGCSVSMFEYKFVWKKLKGLF